MILYLGPNDIYATGPDRLLITENILFNGSLTDYWAAETRGKNPYSQSLLFYVLQRAVPALALRATRPAAAAGTGTIWGQKEVDEIGQHFLENVRTICLIARAHGIEPVLATFMQDMPPGVPFPHGPSATTTISCAHSPPSKKVPLIDLEAALRSVPAKDDYFFADRYHPSRRGAEFIARDDRRGLAMSATT
mgnify:CR=1 FL=1